MRTALVHDWLTGMRGGEKVLSLMCRLLPEADIFTLVHVPGSCDRRIESRRVITSALNELPCVGRYYRYLLPVMPLAIEGLDVSGYDLVISSSHCVAKGVIRRPSSLHICYCYTPMRYAWAQGQAYRETMGPAGLALRLVRGYLRAWDRRSAGHVDHFVGISGNVAERIRRTYGREADIIYPPVDTAYYTPAAVPREDFYLMVTALAPYKRVDQAVEAFMGCGRRLVVIGSGQQLARLRRIAPANVELLGWQSNAAIRDHYRRCRALVFPGEEDFGIVPVEAMACGAPVIAYRAGGALETVRGADAQDPPGPTGLLYGPQTAEALASAVGRFEQSDARFDPQRLREWALRFSEERFLEALERLVRSLLAERGLDPRC